MRMSLGDFLGMMVVYPLNLPGTSLDLFPQRTALCPAHSGQAGEGGHQHYLDYLFKKNDQENFSFYVIEVIRVIIRTVLPVHSLLHTENFPTPSRSPGKIFHPLFLSKTSGSSFSRSKSMRIIATDENQITDLLKG